MPVLQGSLVAVIKIAHSSQFPDACLVAAIKIANWWLL